MRIFWLGMHKILTRTELPRLRQLGYEVFNPPYLSDIPDQSARLDWEPDQPTTLPPEVFKKLSQTNFFYAPIMPDVAELLNDYFDAVIVTIHPGWLHEFLRAYKGKVIYRTYGQHYLASEELWNFRTMRMITERPDFWFVPHSEFTGADEHAWLRQRMTVVPYHLGEDSYTIQDTWAAHAGERRREIMAVCPNIDNDYYRHHFRYLKENFPERHYRYYGVQMRSDIADPNIVGTLPRDQHLAAYQRAAGLLYTYREPRVCYLPPIEMMIAGGPVIFLDGSLLARYYNGPAPGLARDVEDARAKCQLLLNNDAAFINEVTTWQADVRKLYMPDVVNPIFDRVFTDILSPQTHNAATPIVLTKRELEESGQQRVYLLHHYPAKLIHFDGRGNYIAADGIPRVIRKFVKVLLERTNFQVVLTCYAEEVQEIFGFFAATDNRNLRLLVANRKDGSLAGDRRPAFHPTLFGRHWLRNLAMRLANEYADPAAEWSLAALRRGEIARALLMVLGGILVGLAAIAAGASFAVKWLREFVRKWMSRSRKLYMLIPPPFRGFALRHLRVINGDRAALGAINPHYYFFMDSLALSKPLALYLPDFIPHFFQETGEFAHDFRLAKISRHIVRQAKLVFTNSHYSANYLPKTILKPDPAKVRVFPLPQLNTGSAACSHDFNRDQNIEQLRRRIDGRPFLFYPTQNRPTKNLAMLLRAFARLRATNPELCLVLTGMIEHHKPVEEVYRRLKLEPHVVTATGISDAALEWLYKNAVCLSFTSNLEGNFPTQIFEALHYGTPIVGTRLPMIVEKLGEQADHLLLVECEDTDAFAAGVQDVLKNRALVLQKQEMAAAFMRQLDDDEAFAQGVINLVHELGGLPVSVAPQENHEAPAAAKASLAA